LSALSHTHALTDAPVARRQARIVRAVAIFVSLATVISLAVLWPSGDLTDRLGALGYPSDLYGAVVETVIEGGCSQSAPEGSDVTCNTAELRLLAGPDEGDNTTLEFVADTTTTPDLREGDRIVLSYVADAEPGFQYAFADRERRPVLLLLAVLFALAVVVLGRVRGLAALGGLAASLFVIVGFILPAILDGRSPLLVSVVGAAAIAIIALYLAHGFTTTTDVALLGTLASLAVTVVSARVFVDLAQFSGFASEEAIFLNVADANIPLTGLVLGGIVIGALGAIDDMTVTQASVVWELRDANPEMSRSRLFGGAMRIGRDHVASTVNTLALAYAGASMPLLILFVLSRQSIGSVANGEVVATEIVRTLAGSLGLVASVPLTTWLAVSTLGHGGRPEPRRTRRRERRRDPFADEGDDALW
jgi:uncharacterized membrane protein